MTVISTLILRPLPDADLKDVFTSLKEAKAALEGLEGVVSVSVTAVTIGGPATNSMAIMTTATDWEAFGKIQAKINSEPEWIQMLLAAGQLATWQTYVSQTIDFDLLPS